jgi:transcriptional regulator with XRE-family HTH domain
MRSSDKIAGMIRLRVKQIAKEKHISMGKLSRQSDVNYRTIQRIFNEPEYMPTIPTLEKIARVLGVSTGELIEDVPDQAES